MRVKVHPHKTMVNSGVEACVSVTPMRKRGRAYYMGTVFLVDASFVIHESGVKRAQAEQVRNVHAWCVGTLTDESPLQSQLSDSFMARFTQVTYHFNTARFMTLDGVDVTDKAFKAAVFIGRDFYVSTEGL